MKYLTEGLNCFISLEGKLRQNRLQTTDMGIKSSIYSLHQDLLSIY